MSGIKIIIYVFIFITSTVIGLLISKKYEQRVNELKEIKNALNMFKTKVKFTYDPIPDVFNEIAKCCNSKIGKVFEIASYNMKSFPAGDSWNRAIDKNILDINEEDKNILKELSKLLGQTDIEGQISQIELTSSFLDEQIRKAERERDKNEKMYRTLGMIIGLAIVIVLM